MNNSVKPYGVGILGNCCTHNVFEMQFEQHNLTVMPFHNTLIHNGAEIPIEEYLDGYVCLTPFQQLAQAIETSTVPDSNAEIAGLGVEVLMAAYKSTTEHGTPIPLPLAEGENPLVGANGLV